MSEPTSGSSAPRIAIIGGGLAGACAAWALRTRGAQITVFEQQTVASGASGAAAGMMQPLSGKRLVLHPDSARGFALSRALLHKMFGADSHWHRPGVLRLVRDPERATQWHARVRDLPHGLARWLERPELLGFEPRLAPDVCAGVYIPDGCMVDVPAFIRALLSKSNATVREHAQVVDLTTTTSHVSVRVRGDDAPHRFDHVVVASGAACPDPLRDADVEMRPYMGILAVFDGLRPPTIALNYRGYVAPWRDGSVLVGTVDRRPPFGNEPSEESIGWLRERLGAVLQLDTPPRLQYAWKGIRPAMRDHSPIARASTEHERTWFLTGFGGRGLMVGPLLAQRLAAQILGPKRGCNEV